jgi:hypothetical protein
MRAGLPPKATDPRSFSSDAELRARQSLASFTAYPARARSIGKELPQTQGVSRRRAAVLQKIKELEQQERAERRVVIFEDGAKKLKLAFDPAGKFFRFVEEDLTLWIARRSISYSAKDSALRAWHRDGIIWIERLPLP